MAYLAGVALQRFRCNPLQFFDDSLKRDLAYAWSLPTHPTFEMKMELIREALDKTATSAPCPHSQIQYFTRKISEIVRERIEIHRLQMQAVSLAAESTAEKFDPVSDSELPPLID